ncbi:hypothetical protein V1477_003862 [Vespula maculifrons]|uniref:Uncharacterized protein n=1 Tax=Vespula maculifrons TaxID=7453 RepID=A0ABD2CS99_VESMC
MMSLITPNLPKEQRNRIVHYLIEERQPKNYCKSYLDLTQDTDVKTWLFTIVEYYDAIMHY